MIFDGKFDGSDAIQSEMNVGKPNELVLSYAKHMITVLPAVKEPKRILVIGLGGACLQRYLYALLPNATIETAELDPAVRDVANRFFGYKEDSRQKCYIGDGRKFIAESKDKYDIIMLDAFSATSIPYMLATQEFLKICKDHLAEGGLVAANLWYEEASYNDMLATYATVFAEQRVLKCPGSTNAILIAMPAKQDLTAANWMAKATEFEKTHATGLNLPKLIEVAYEKTTTIPSSATVLLDKDADKHK
jgi:spermidine synthase